MEDRVEKLVEIFVPDHRAEYERAREEYVRSLTTAMVPAIGRQSSTRVGTRVGTRAETRAGTRQTVRLTRAGIREKLAAATECEMCGVAEKDHSGGGWWATLRIPDAMVVCVRCEKSSRYVAVNLYVARAKAILEYVDSSTTPPRGLFVLNTLAPIRPDGHALDPGRYYELATRSCQFTGIPGVQNHVLSNTIVAGKTPREMLRDSGLAEFIARLRRVVLLAGSSTGTLRPAGSDPEYSVMVRYADHVENLRRKYSDNPRVLAVELTRQARFANVTGAERTRCDARLREYKRYVPRLARKFDRIAPLCPVTLPTNHIEYMYSAFYLAPGKTSIRSVKERLGTTAADSTVLCALKKLHEERSVAKPLPEAPPKTTKRASRIPDEHIKAVYEAYFDEKGVKRKGASIDSAIIRTGVLYAPQNMMKRIREMRDVIHGM